ncbi:MAG: polysaccharide deacetylase family protein [Deltaproteobacteria bacterium]|nr:polysaccharide deacetylase family protein [Deltaproteobacteria bacterium]
MAEAPAPSLGRTVRGAAINVDIDSLHLYYRIHGHDEGDLADVVWERGVTRFAELFARLGIKATFFVVASDIDRWPFARRIAEDLARDGHELASHSLTHPYDLVRQHDRAVRTELEESRAIISAVRGSPCVGFRAPGYTMTARVLRLIRQAGYRYDSSLFPSPPYYLAKLAVLTAMALRGKRSHSIVGPPSVMWEDRLPHYREGLVELPVTVLPGLRLPVIGTSLIMAGERGYRLLAPWLARVPFVNLELHGIDLCDLEADGIDPVMRKQPDLRVPLATKLALFERVFSDLRDALGVRTLEQHVERPTHPD